MQWPGITKSSGVAEQNDVEAASLSLGSYGSTATVASGAPTMSGREERRAAVRRLAAKRRGAPACTLHHFASGGGNGGGSSAATLAPIIHSPEPPTSRPAAPDVHEGQVALTPTVLSGQHRGEPRAAAGRRTSSSDGGRGSPDGSRASSTAACSVMTTTTIDHGRSSCKSYVAVASGECHMALLDSGGQLLTTAFGLRDRMTMFGRRPETYGELGHGKVMWSHQRREETRLAFHRFDVDNDGCLVKDELRLLIDSLGLCVSDEYLDTALRNFDVDHSGSIEFAEFEKLFEFLKREGAIAPRTVQGALQGLRVVQVSCGDQVRTCIRVLIRRTAACHARRDGVTK